MSAFRAGLIAWLKRLFIKSTRYDASADISPVHHHEPAAAAPFSLPGEGLNFLLAARLASVARFNTKAGRKPMRPVRLEPGAKPVPVAKQGARRVPKPTKAPLLASSRSRVKQGASGSHSATVVRLPERHKPTGTTSLLLNRAA
jgi:hypothetical protein